MMKLYELTDNISDEDRLARMESYLDEMIRLTDELEENNVQPTDNRNEDKRPV